MRIPVFPQLNDKEHAKALKYHQTLAIPSRFSVLAGEIIHHFRSCFDHIAWGLSSESYRAAHWKIIEFPVLDTRPPEKDNFTKYARKIQGITSVDALNLIKNFQPYNSHYPRTDRLWVIHDMDRVDKHRELVIVSGKGYVELPQPLAFEFARYMRAPKGTRFSAEFRRQFNQHAKISPQIVFSNFGGGKHKAVVPGLQELAKFTREAVGLFESELLKF